MPAPVQRNRPQLALTREIPWLVAALALGIGGGLLAPGLGGDAVTLVFGASALLAAAVLVMRDTRNGLYLLLLAIPLDLAGRIITQPYVVTVYHLVLLLTLVSWAIRVAQKGPDPAAEFSVVHIGAFVLLAAAVWSLPFSLDRSATTIAVIRLGFTVALFMLFVQHLRDEKTMDRVLAVLVATSAASSLLALVQSFVPSLIVGDPRTLGIGLDVVSRPAALFSDPNYLAGFLSVAIVAAFARAAYAKNLRGAVPWLAGALLSSAGLLVTLSRTGWVGIAVGLLVAALTAPRRRRAKLLVSLAVALTLVVALAPGLVLSRLESIGDVQTDASISTRWLMFGSTVEMFQDHWVFGTGLDAYDEAYPAYRRLGALRDILKPHELPLALPAEMGIPGLIGELLIIGGVALELVRHRHQGWTAWQSVGVTGLVALLVQSLFQYYLYFEYLWVFLALTVAAMRLARPAREV